MSRPRLAAAAVLAPALVVWTWLLLEPNPVPEPVLTFLSVWDFLPYLLAKTLHATGYAGLTALAWVAAPPGRWRLAAVAFMALHGAGTEIGQTFVPNRTGKATDVLIDCVGVTIGVLAARMAWHLSCGRGTSAPPPATGGAEVPRPQAIKADDGTRPT